MPSKPLSPRSLVPPVHTRPTASPATMRRAAAAERKMALSVRAPASRTGSNVGNLDAFGGRSDAEARTPKPWGLFVSGDFFRELGVQPIMGRVFTTADDRKGCGLPGAVVSYTFWQRELGGNAVAIGRKLTLNGASVTNNVWLDGAGSNSKMDSNFDWIGGGYLKTMGMTLLAGRDFDGRDATSSPPVAIVNQSFARKLGLSPNPVGKRFRREATPSQPETVFEIAGLVKDTKYFNLREEFRRIAFLSTTQDADPDPFAQFMVNFNGPLADVTSRIRNAVKEVSPSIVVDYRAFDETIREGLLRERLMATLSGFFGTLAALIAAVGLYGVMSYLVVRRTNEIGIRMAVGASRGNIVGLVLQEAAKLLIVCLAVGAVLAIAAGYAAGSLLFGLRPTDAGILGMAATLLAAVTIAASCLPAWRASRLEPMTALREE